MICWSKACSIKSVPKRLKPSETPWQTCDGTPTAARSTYRVDSRCWLRRRAGSSLRMLRSRSMNTCTRTSQVFVCYYRNICMYTYICVHTYIYIYTYIYIHIFCCMQAPCEGNHRGTSKEKQVGHRLQGRHTRFPP